MLDRILLEVEDYKKSLEAKGIELHVNRSEKNLQTTDYGLDTVINVEGIKEKNRNFIQKEYGWIWTESPWYGLYFTGG